MAIVHAVGVVSTKLRSILSLAVRSRSTSSTSKKPVVQRGSSWSRAVCPSATCGTPCLKQPAWQCQCTHQSPWQPSRQDQRGARTPVRKRGMKIFIASVAAIVFVVVVFNVRVLLSLLFLIVFAVMVRIAELFCYNIIPESSVRRAALMAQ